MNDNVRWCCSAFRNSFERLDERGSRVVAVVSGMFLLVFRSVDPEFIGTFTVPVPLSLVEDVPLRFCPWCGRDLAKHYAKQGALQRLEMAPSENLHPRSTTSV